MGRGDDVEICDLAGIYILPKLESKTSKNDIGFYRDDSFMFLRDFNGQQTDKIKNIYKKIIIKVFKTLGFQIEIETNLHKVNFLDMITFNLRNGTHYH